MEVCSLPPLPNRLNRRKTLNSFKVTVDEKIEHKSDYCVSNSAVVTEPDGSVSVSLREGVEVSIIKHIVNCAVTGDL